MDLGAAPQIQATPDIDIVSPFRDAVSPLSIHVACKSVILGRIVASANLQENETDYCIITVV